MADYCGRVPVYGASGHGYRESKDLIIRLLQVCPGITVSVSDKSEAVSISSPHLLAGSPTLRAVLAIHMAPRSEQTRIRGEAEMELFADARLPHEYARALSTLIGAAERRTHVSFGGHGATFFLRGLTPLQQSMLLGEIYAHVRPVSAPSLGWRSSAEPGMHAVAGLRFWKITRESIPAVEAVADWMQKAGLKAAVHWDQQQAPILGCGLLDNDATERVLLHLIQETGRANAAPDSRRVTVLDRKAVCNLQKGFKYFLTQIHYWERVVTDTTIDLAALDRHNEDPPYGVFPTPVNKVLVYLLNQLSEPGSIRAKGSFGWIDDCVVIGWDDAADQSPAAIARMLDRIEALTGKAQLEAL